MSTGFFNELWVSKAMIFRGIYMCLFVSITAIIIGTLIGIIIGLALTYGNIFVRFFARFYVDVIRGIPVLVLILTIYFVLPVINIELGPLQAGIVSLAIFASAQVAEMLRGGLQNVPKGQIEGAKAVGLGFLQTFTYVSLPQALRQVLPTWVNTAVEIVKGTTLISLIGVVEINWAQLPYNAILCFGWAHLFSNLFLNRTCWKICREKSSNQMRRNNG